MSAESAYLDSSAFVKLIGPEPESRALEGYLRAWPDAVSSALLRVEALRAAAKWGSVTVLSTRERLEDVVLVAIDNLILELASSIGPQFLRSLDAIHLATAMQLGDDLGVIVTYDQRLARAAAELGLPVASPV
ncbi:MAG TPA: type II toxin-antitoxin system VapC family toxin [Chloroflexota bacterium]|nr:type II toxin-antitoxin system VapC family toxin [Chloroflexota bacterium]